MAEVVLRKCCRFCKFAKSLKAYGGVVKKTKLVCSHEDNDGVLKKFYSPHGITHEHGYCDNFEWGDPKKYGVILKTFENMKKEE